ncbi:hypothetical protein SAMN05216223_10568 [Actinacidiphila yanglinensis]|uniref:Uncharacterized protein n=1 Tax=Actinacidiphila yanglinensis TaxID=310779 RepID=A0A1H6A0F6_9ACTN|nr:hypothetical protein [Actinacidiphila yanglinensis]SEG41832.1 hypothetical protein SAMN05216223_10568 [Actinacidiphila yanglinensis]
MTDEERELSALLERAVPQLPAPAQRLERVRERMRRRRKRRAAIGASATAVVVVAAVGLLLPELGAGRATNAQRTQAQSGARTPASTQPGAGRATGGPATTGSPTPTGTALSTVPPGYRLSSFPALAGARLRTPPSWYVLDPAGKDTAYVSTQRLGLPKNGCDQALDDFCTPLVRNLDKGGVLIQVRVTHNQLMADKFRLQGRLIGPEPVVAACRTVGGTDQLVETFSDPSGSDALIQATACMSHPTSADQAQVHDVLTTADFG